MEQQSVRKTFKYRLKPAPDQERLLERTLMLCRHVYNAAVEERREAWRQRGVSVTYRKKPESPCLQAGDEWPLWLDGTLALRILNEHA